ncbi:MAG TPA: tyrosine--tRNA ligase [Actinomycetes bacterium]|nr:tyrosine--tRNA ligase [Actinomycetes bacterium]
MGNDRASTNRVDIIDELAWRGLIAQSTDLDELAEHFRTGSRTLYSGFDPTAPSLHAGHLLQVLTLRRFQDTGHRPLGLVGGATGLIGDPRTSGERQLHPPDVVAGWVERIRHQLERYLDFSDSHAAPAELVNNLDWTASLTAIEFLRDIGKHFPVNRMLDREAVAARLASGGISYTEFSYQLLQSNDYLELYRRYGCTLQIGGSDQWGNITAGVDLIRRITGERVHALTTPLLTRADGTKYGKSEGGALWLDPELTTPYAFYQFWINVEDAVVPALLRRMTFRSREEIEELEKDTAERPHLRAGQRVLAQDLTTLVHGQQETSAVEAASAALFGRGELAAVEPSTLGAALRETPHVSVPAGELPTLTDLFVAAELSSSKSAARRAIDEGGAYVNNQRRQDPDWRPSEDDLLHGRWLVLRRGKRSLAGVEVV